MPLRISTNVSSLIAQRHLGTNNDRAEKSMERLASGRRINRSMDDAAGLAVTSSMQGQIRGLNQARRNANDAISMLQVAEGGTNELANILVRMRELTVQAASDTYSNEQRGYLNREYTQLADEIDRITATVEFNGNKFFVAEESQPSEYVIQVGMQGTKPEQNRDTISIDLKGLRFTTESLGIGKGAEIGPNGEEGPPTRDIVSSRLRTIDAALTRVASERATIGATQARFISAVQNTGVALENLGTAKSRILDTDFAEETAELTKNQILKQSSLSVLATANQSPEVALTLLR